MFEFKIDGELDSRSVFVNKLCKMIYDMCNGDLNATMSYIQSIHDDIDEHVRNVYQFVDSEIPLLAYYNLITYGAENYGLSPKEYIEALARTVEACKYYYK